MEKIIFLWLFVDNISCLAMKRYFLLFVLFLSVACSDEAVDRRVEAYLVAKERAVKATTSDELARVSYNLYYELLTLDRELGPLDSISALAVSGNKDCLERMAMIDGAREAFEQELLKKEMEFYVSMSKKKRR